MKRHVTTLTERGQVSVPAEIRRDLRLTPGAKLHWQEISDHECRITVREQGPGAQAVRGYAASFRKTRTTAEWLAELREGETD